MLSRETMPEDEPADGYWKDAQSIGSGKFLCGFCGALVASQSGWSRGVIVHGDIWEEVAWVRICPHCNHPTYFAERGQYPAPPHGVGVKHVPPLVGVVYDEARECITVGAYTASVLACRKLLMHIAVEKGAKPGEHFTIYVDYLAAKGYAPPGAKDWVDRIRDKGNDANHEIVQMKREDAEELLTFIEMLLKFLYEFPTRAKKAKETA